MLNESNFTHAKQFLEYHRSMGLFTWTVGGQKRRVGDLAGSSRAQFRQFPVITVQGILFPADRLAWYMVYGEVADRPLVPKNEDYDDVRIENLLKIA
jgi:hypothetical protein